MKKIVSLLLVLVMVFAMVPVASAAYSSVTIDMTKSENQAKVRMLGRTVADGNKGIRLDWAASGFEFKLDFEGDFKMTCSAEKNAFVLVTVDGEALNVETVKEKRIAVQKDKAHEEYTFCKSVSAGTHTVRVLRNSDLAVNGTVWVEAITANCDASTMAPTAQKDMFIEFIGDSITSGCGTILTGDNPEPWNEKNHSGPLSYGYQAAQMLDADWALTSKGGIGAWAKASGYSMPEIYDYVNRYFYKDASGQPVEWDFSRKPDYIVCALGTNDTVNADHTEQEFYGAMVPFIKNLREKNGEDCKIIFFHNMMSVKHGEMLKILCQQFGGEAKGYYVLKAIKGNNGAIASGAKTGHPDYADNEKNAVLLAAYITGLQGEVVSVNTLLKNAADTVKAEKDVVVYEDTVIPAGVTLDLNGHNLYVKDDMTLTVEGAVTGGTIVDKARVKYPTIGTTVPLATANVKTFGRILPDPTGLQVIWPHSAIEFTANFSGDLVLDYDSALPEKKTHTAELRVFLDDQPSVYVSLPTGTGKSITLLKNVPVGTHTVRIVNEADLDVDSNKITTGRWVTWKSLKFTGKMTNMRATPEKELYIEYIGDSITSGKGCLGWTPNGKYHNYNSTDPATGVPTSHSATHSYSYQSAQFLDADWMIVSRGGAGFIRDDSSCPKVMELMYDYYNPFASYDAVSSKLVPYTPARTPDVVVLALGTNDGDTSPSTTTHPLGVVDFDTAAKSMIKKVWSKYGKEIPIILLYGMMSTSHAASFPTIAAAMNGEGGNVYSLKVVKNNDGSTSSNSAHHPSANGHAINAELLADFINENILKENATTQSLASLIGDATSGTVIATKDCYVGKPMEIPADLTVDMAGHKLIVTDYVDVDENGVWNKDSTEARLKVCGTVLNAELPQTEGILICPGGSLNEITVPEGCRYASAAVDPALTPDAYSLNLNSEVVLNFYTAAKKVAAYDDPCLLVDGEKYSSAGVKDEYLFYPTKPFYAKEMGDTVNVQMYAVGKNGVAHLGKKLTASIRKYAEDTIRDVYWDGNDQYLGKAMVAMLNYGAEAQKAFGYKMDTPMNADVVQHTEKLKYLQDNVTFADEHSGEGCYYGTSCVLGSNMELKFYLRLDSAEGLTATVNYTDYQDNPVEKTLDLVKNETDGFYSVKLADLVAADIKTLVTLKVEDASEQVIAAVTDSISAYAGRVCQQESEETTPTWTPVAKAMVIYGLSARDYFTDTLPMEEDELPIF